MADELGLKWGSLKYYDAETPEFSAALDKLYATEVGVSMSAAMQDRSPEFIDALCEVIDACSGTITIGWPGEKYSKEETKEYVRNYGK
jgi:hypothetical protein